MGFVLIEVRNSLLGFCCCLKLFSN